MIARLSSFWIFLVILGLIKLTSGQYGSACCNTQCCCSVCANCDAAPGLGSGSWPPGGGLGPLTTPCNCQNLSYTCHAYPNVPSPGGSYILPPASSSYALPPAPYVQPQPPKPIQSSSYVQPPQIPPYQPPLAPSPCNKPSCTIMPIPKPPPAQPCICAIQPCTLPCITAEIDIPITFRDEIIDDGRSFWDYDKDFLNTPQGIIVLVVVILLAILVLCLLIALIVACIRTFCCCCKNATSSTTTRVHTYQTDQYPYQHNRHSYYDNQRPHETY